LVGKSGRRRRRRRDTAKNTEDVFEFLRGSFSQKKKKKKKKKERLSDINYIGCERYIYITPAIYL
jgi:hypothetical protein